MNLIQINNNLVINPDQIQAIEYTRRIGQPYTQIYLIGGKEFVVEGYIKILKE